MSITYVPVILNNAPVLNVNTLNATDVNVSDDITVAGDATVSGIFSGVTGGFTGTFTVGSALNANGGLNTSTVSAIEVSIANSPAAFEVFKVRVTNDTQPRFSVTAAGTVGWGPGSVTPPDTTLTRSGVNALSTPGFFAMGSGQSSGDFSVFGTSLSLGTAGGGIRIKEGTNARMGVVTLAAGLATVPNTSVTANSRIFLTAQSLGTVTKPQALAVTNRTPGSQFVIESFDVTDTSVVAWEIKEPA